MRMPSQVKILSAVLLIASASLATAQTPQQVARQAFGATVLLVMEDKDGQPSSMGSGFLVQEGILVTNLHVLEGAHSGYAKLVNQNTRYAIQGVVAIDENRDLALLKISLKGVTPLPLVRLDAVEVADIVYAVGNPYGLEGTFSQGIVSGIRQVGNDKLLQITAPISPGSSGGPVLNLQGHVIGVSVATFVEGQNLNFAIPADYVTDLLQATGIVKPLGSLSYQSGPSSILAGQDNESQEYVTTTAFAWRESKLFGYYLFSVRNGLRQAIKNVVCIVIFYGNDGLPIESELVTVAGPIGAGLAKRSTEFGRGNAEEVRNLTKKTELRVLTYELTN